MKKKPNPDWIDAPYHYQSYNAGTDKWISVEEKKDKSGVLAKVKYPFGAVMEIKMDYVDGDKSCQLNAFISDIEAIEHEFRYD